MFINLKMTNYRSKKMAILFSTNYEPLEVSQFQGFKYWHFDNAISKKITRSNDKLEPVRDVFKISSQIL